MTVTESVTESETEIVTGTVTETVIETEIEIVTEIEIAIITEKEAETEEDAVVRMMMTAMEESHLVQVLVEVQQLHPLPLLCRILKVCFLCLENSLNSISL